MAQAQFSDAAGTETRVTIATPGTTTADRSLTISGSVTDGSGAGQAGRIVDIADDGAAVGTATVADDGTWSSDILLAHLGANALTARARGAAGILATSGPVVFTLDTVLSPPSGGAAPATGEPNPSPPPRTIHPPRDGIVSATGGADAFVFQAHPGHATVIGFDLAGSGGDTLSFSCRSFATLRDVLHHTTMSGDGAVIHLTPRDSITLVGVSKGALRAGPGAFAFHP